MKLQLLYDLQQEINRLFIAGSKFAKGDPRLQRHIPVLNKLGEKAPVFKKLATDIKDLLDADSQQSPEKLMAISTLLYSVLYTQGDLVESDVEESTQIPNIPLEEVNTEYSYLQLKPVIQALTTSNSGRLEVLKDALERNVFNDSRTYQYLDIALGDKYTELSDYVEKTIIPKIGKPMLPFLSKNFKYEDKTENARRLRLLYKLGYTKTPELVEAIMSLSLPALQAEAIMIMSNDPANEGLIIKLADDKNKQVREAAYKALAQLGTRTSLEKLKDVYINNKNKTNLPLIVSALASSKLPFFFQEVFDQVVRSFEEFITSGKDEKDKVLADKLEKFRYDIDILGNKSQPVLLEFFSRVLKSKEYNGLIAAKKNILENSASFITGSILSSLQSFSKAQAIGFYESNINDIPESDWNRALWEHYFHDAIDAGYTKERIFDTFGLQFNKRGSVNLNDLYTAFSNQEYYSLANNKDEAIIYVDKIDKRWLNILYDLFKGDKYKWKYDHDCALALLSACETDKKKFDELLIYLTKRTMPNDQAILFKFILDRKIKDCYEVIYSTMAKYAPKSYFYGLNWLKHTGFWKQFPKEYAAKYRELYKKNPLQIYEDVAQEIESANKNQ